MVPVDEDPPVTPFTCQVTAWLVLLVTLAENCVVVPSRVSAAPETVTVTTAGVTGAGVVENFDADEQPSINASPSALPPSAAAFSACPADSERNAGNPAM